MKSLILVRGLPGAGKSTLASLFGARVIEADQYFIDANGKYAFDAAKLSDAHRDCFSRCRDSMENDDALIVVANTFTKEWEMAKYFEVAVELGYTVHTVVVENRHAGSSVHGVPNETVSAMRGRFEVVL